jgi:hypothetical protein
MGQAGKGASRTARAAGEVKPAVNLPGNLRTAARGIRVAATLRQQIELPETTMKHRDDFRAHLLPVCRPVQICQAHAAAYRVIQGRVEGEMLLPANHPNSREPKIVPGRGSSADVIRISAAKRK